jgi:hypothetical protein
MVKITGLTAEGTPVEADLLAIVDDVAGTATTKKATIGNVLAANDARTKTETNTTIDANGTGNVISNIGLAEMEVAGKTEVWAGAMSDETTVLSAATDQLTFVIPYGFEITDVLITLTTAGTGAALVTVDINDDGSTILSTKLTIDASEKTSSTAATAAVLSATTVAAGSIMSFDIDTIDTDNVAAGLKVYITGYQT